MYDEGNPLGLDYTSLPDIGEQLRAGVDFYKGLGSRFMGAVTLIPDFLSQFREANKAQAEKTYEPTSNLIKEVIELPESYASAESRMAEGVGNLVGQIPGVPKVVEDASVLAASILSPFPSEVNLLPMLGTIRLTKVGKQFPELAETASKYMDDAETYLKKHGSLEGYPRFIDPEGAEYLPRPKGKKLDGTPRLAMSPMSVKQAYTNTRKGRDVTSDAFEAFQRKQFNQMVRQNKTDLLMQYAEMPSYVEHNRRLSSPFWETARAKGQKAGDVDNLSQLFDLDFKNFKDNVDKALDRIPNSPIDAFYDPLVDSIVVENIKTGRQLGYLNQTDDIKTQLTKYIQKIK